MKLGFNSMNIRTDSQSEYSKYYPYISYKKENVFKMKKGNYFLTETSLNLNSSTKYMVKHIIYKLENIPLTTIQKYI